MNFRLVLNVIRKKVTDNAIRFISNKRELSCYRICRWHYFKGFENTRRCVSGASAVLGCLFSLNLLKKLNYFESSDDVLINTIKRSILCIRHEQYDKAEQMLHLALRMAQDIQSNDGITYVLDVMANLAMERKQYEKSEKLYSDVMKRLIIDGYSLESAEILHISSKLSHMAQLRDELDKSFNGFTWTLDKIQEVMKKTPNDSDFIELFGLTSNWFGQLQMKRGYYIEAKQLFLDAYNILIKIHGKNEDAITILNNLSVACANLDDLKMAETYLLEALTIISELDNVTQEAVLKANLGLIYLRQGLVENAKELCSAAWKSGKKSNNTDAVEQSEYCLNEIKNIIK